MVSVSADEEILEEEKESNGKDDNEGDKSHVSERKSKMEHFEIDTTNVENEEIPIIATVPSEDTIDEHDDVEIQSLLRETTGDNHNQQQQQRQQRQKQQKPQNETCSCCWNKSSSSGIRHGNLWIVSPWLYTHTKGWGVIGPHWFGPPFVVAIVLYATYFFGISRSLNDLHRPVSALLCGIGAACTMYHLLNAAYRDPGIIVPGRYSIPDPVPRNYRWCEICQYYQPPSAAHCPDCNVCIAGYDHHCVWMGTCIGVGNFKPFMRFNLSWLTYLVYAILWITVLAPISNRIEAKHHDHHNATNQTQEMNNTVNNNESHHYDWFY